MKQRIAGKGQESKEERVETEIMKLVINKDDNYNKLFDSSAVNTQKKHTETN